jgi:hypothetical protein
MNNKRKGNIFRFLEWQVYKDAKDFRKEIKVLIKKSS